MQYSFFLTKKQQDVRKLQWKKKIKNSLHSYNKSWLLLVRKCIDIFPFLVETFVESFLKMFCNWTMIYKLTAELLKNC